MEDFHFKQPTDLSPAVGAVPGEAVGRGTDCQRGQKAFGAAQLTGTWQFTLPGWGQICLLTKRLERSLLTVWRQPEPLNLGAVGLNSHSCGNQWYAHAERCAHHCAKTCGWSSGEERRCVRRLGMLGLKMCKSYKWSRERPFGAFRQFHFSGNKENWEWNSGEVVAGRGPCCGHRDPSGPNAGQSSALHWWRRHSPRSQAFALGWGLPCRGWPIAALLCCAGSGCRGTVCSQLCCLWGQSCSARTDRLTGSGNGCVLGAVAVHSARGSAWTVGHVWSDWSWNSCSPCLCLKVTFNVLLFLMMRLCCLDCFWLPVAFKILQLWCTQRAPLPD